MLCTKIWRYYQCDGQHLGKYSGYSYYLSTGTANGTIYPETRWTPGIGFNFGYQFGFKLSNRFWMDASILGKVVQGKAESFDLNETTLFRGLIKHGYGDLP